MKKFPSGFKFIALLIFFLSPAFFASVARAQTKIEEWQNEIEGIFIYMPATEAKAQSGRVEMYSSNKSYSYNMKLFEQLPVTFSLEADYRGINNSTNVKLPSRLVGVSTGIGTYLPLLGIKNTYLGIEIDPSFYSDNWTFDSSTFRIPMQYYGIYQANDKLTLVAGVEIFPRYEDNIWPVFGFIYEPNDKLSFNITMDKPVISYKISDRLKIFLEGDANIEEYKVNRDSGKDIIRYSNSSIGAGIEYKINKNFKLHLTAGDMFNRSIRYRKGSGKVSLKDSFYSEFAISANL